MRIGLLAFALASIAGIVANANAEQAVTVTIFEYGIYTAQEVKPPSGVNENMKAAQIKNICHVATTLVIPTRDRLKFGFRFHVDGPLPGAIIGLRKTVRWPDHTKPPQVPEIYATNEQIQRVRVGEASYTGWTNWQTRPGIWTFKLFQGAQELASLTFKLEEKPAADFEPDPNSACFPISALPREKLRWHST